MSSQVAALRLTRLTSIEAAETVDEVMELVFQTYNGDFDDNLSIYYVPLDKTTQIQSEHTGHSKKQPETKGAVILQHPRPAPEPDPDGGWFSFRSGTHHVIHFASIDQAEELADEILRNIEHCLVVTQEDDMNTYIRGRIAQSDAEWFNACKASKTVKKWVARICEMNATKLGELIDAI